MTRLVWFSAFALVIGLPARGALEEMRCMTIVDDMDRAASLKSEMDWKAYYSSKQVAWEVLPRLKSYPGMSSATAAAARKIRESAPPAEVDLAPLLALSDCNPVGFFRHWRLLIESSKRYHFSNEERDAVAAAAVSFLKKDLDSVFILLPLGIRIALLQELSDASIVRLTEKQRTELAQLRTMFESKKDQARARFQKWESLGQAGPQAFQNLPAAERREVYLALQSESAAVHAMAKRFKGVLK